MKLATCVWITSTTSPDRVAQAFAPNNNCNHYRRQGHMLRKISKILECLLRGQGEEIVKLKKNISQL